MRVQVSFLARKKIIQALSFYFQLFQVKDYGSSTPKPPIMDALQSRLTQHNERLASTGAETLNTRQRRRILQKVSKLKKQMLDISSTSTTVVADNANPDANPAAVGKKRTFPDATTSSNSSNKRPRPLNSAAAAMIVAPSLNRAQRKKKIVGTNNRLNELARRKQLTKAEQCFQRAKKAGLFDVHTYTNMINVYVRVGQVDRALEIFRDMSLNRLKPNIVTYTTMLKGLGACALFNVVEQLLDEMVSAQPPHLPTVRTVNTLMRSYARHGRPDLAVHLFHQCQHEWHVNLDASTYEQLISVLSNAHRMKEVIPMIEQLRHAAQAAPTRQQLMYSTAAAPASSMYLAGEADAAENPAIYIDCARGKKV